MKVENQVEAESRTYITPGQWKSVDLTFFESNG